MPHSAHWSTSTMLDHVVRLQPRTVLDVGYGYGKWGFLIREALDFVNERHEPGDWQVRIEGIDAHPVASPLADWVYNETRAGDILEEAVAGYDLVVMGDVIEHIEKEMGVALVDRLIAQNGCVLVNTPRDFFQQEILANPYEMHKSLWTTGDFERWPADVDVRGGTITAAIRGASGSYPPSRAVKASRFVRHVPYLRKRGSAAAAVKEVVTHWRFR